jgi:uroporphyrinogen-III synthase
MKPELAGVAVLVTRPAGQSGRVAALIEASGGNPVLFPALQIEPLPQIDVAAALHDLQKFGLVIFVSPNAVRLGMPAIVHNGGLPAHARIAAVGPGTVAELKNSGVRDIISPQNGFDSEALIRELKSLPLNGSRALIVRGRGGRELLAETLRSRGVEVEYFECYQRVSPDRDFDELLPLWQSGDLKACIATSSAIVMNLCDMAGQVGRSWLLATPFFVSHPRVAATAFSRGVQRVIVAGNGDEALVAGLKTWFARLRPLVNVS